MNNFTVETSHFDGTKSITFQKLVEDSANHADNNIPEISSLSQTTENLAIVLYTSGSTGIPKGNGKINKLFSERKLNEYSCRRCPFAT